MFYDILDQIMEFKMFLILTRQYRLAPLNLFYVNRIFLKLHNWARIYKFYSKLCNLKHKSICTLMLHLPQVAVDVMNMNAVSSGP